MNDMVKLDEAQAMALLEQVVIGGDLSKLQPKDRLAYYAQVCQSVGLNPLTKPFEYINLNGKLVLYAKRDATDQLRSVKCISIQIVARDLIGDIYVVTARATSKGREDEATGAVCINGLKGEGLANAYMKAETKAKRRVTLSIAGLGMLDETEIGDVDPETGERTPRAVAGMPRTSAGGMEPADYAVFEKAIAELTNKADAEALWKTIAAACFAAKDEAANNGLKAKIVAKVESFTVPA